jgi:hypothetical protein
MLLPSNRQRHHRQPPRRDRPLEPPANRHRPLPLVALVADKPQTPDRLGDPAGGGGGGGGALAFPVEQDETFTSTAFAASLLAAVQNNKG